MAQWYYGENGAQIGPLDENTIRAAIGEGRVNLQTLVWREGMASWLPLASVPELFSATQIYAPPGTPVYYGPTSLPIGVQTSGLAIASMVCGIAGLLLIFCIYGIAGIPAVICGHMALNAIEKSPVPLAGRGMAISGLVMGYLQLLLIAAVVVAIAIGSIK